jgi:cellulose synthase/poly-beta-1,6-N-acetylglucosamine synthase-like glycosyltransferase
MKGIMAATTPLVALCDDDAIWTPQFLRWMVAPFDDPKMGGTGSKQEMIPVSQHETFWEVIADFRLSMRMMEASATTCVDGGISCLSGRTAVYLRKILTDPDFGVSFVNEKWLDKYHLHSGDDKFITRWLVSHSWNMQLQNHKEANLLTTFKDNSTFLRQVLRWTRNTWRSDITSLLFERHIWWRRKWTGPHWLYIGAKQKETHS